jgi:hypothetical protein
VSRLLAAALLAACASPGAGRATADDAPALIVDPTPQSRAALVQALGDALGVQVMLADDALTSESKLEIERTHREGREMGTPEQFVLVRSGGKCVLIHQRTQKRYPLADTECVEAH